MKTTILALLVLMQVALTAQTYITDDTISGTWTKAGSPYYIMNDVVVTGLVIEPGVNVVFTGYYNFLVANGELNPGSSLIAIGAENDSIRFTVSDTTGYYNNSHTGWAGFGDGEDLDNMYAVTFIMKYCTIEYCKTWAIEIMESTFYITDSRIQYNGAGIYAIYPFGNDNTPVERCLIADNNGDGIKLRDGLGELLAPKIKNCKILNNNGVGFNGGYHSIYSQIDNCLIKGNTRGIYTGYESNTIIKDCIIENNGSPDINGGGLFIDGYTWVHDCIFRNNIAKNGGGIYDRGQAWEKLYLNNVLITGNSAIECGGGIYLDQQWGSSYKNITCVNNSTGITGGGIYCPGFTWQWDTARVVNSIIRNNFPNQVFDTVNNIAVSFTNIEGGHSGPGNIDEDPLFLLPENNDFHLSWVNFPEADYTKSPCIDTGNPGSPYDPDGTIADMGYSFFNQNNQVNYSLDLHVFLQGPFQTDQMTTQLNIAGILPFNHPYANSPWNHPGNEIVPGIPASDIVDWIFIEIREPGFVYDNHPYSALSRQAVFVKNDGSVTGLSGSSLPTFHTNVTDSMYVMVYHRNHAPVISAVSVNPLLNTLEYDFTTGEQQALGDHSLVELNTGIWGMIAADGNNDGQVDNRDKDAVWEMQNGQNGYLPGDFNMDGAVDGSDIQNRWRLNAGKGSKKQGL